VSTAATIRALAAAKEDAVKLEELLPLYLKQAQPRPSVKTAIRNAWPKFLGFCAQHDLVEVAELRKHHVEDFYRELLWQSSQLGQLYKANSVDQIVRRARQVLRWAFCEGLVTPDPTHGLLLPRPVQPVPKILSWSQVQELLAVPDRNTPAGLRDALVFQLLAETHLGVTGVVALTLDSVSQLNLHDTTQELLADYLKEGRPALGGEGAWLFFGCYGDPLTDHQAGARLRQAAHQIGLESLPSRVLRKSYLAMQKQVHQRHAPFQA